MHKEQLFKALETAITETAEHLIFQDLAKVRQEPLGNSFTEDDFQVMIKILQPFKAKLFLFYQKVFADQLVTEMVGENIEYFEQVIDGLKELSNTIAGKFMANYVQEERFKIGLPNCTQRPFDLVTPQAQIFNFYFDETHIGALLNEE